MQGMKILFIISMAFFAWFVGMSIHFAFQQKEGYSVLDAVVAIVYLTGAALSYAEYLTENIKGVPEKYSQPSTLPAKH
jgi:hypothetical protein